MREMKTLTLGGKTYEIVDAAARATLEAGVGVSSWNELEDKPFYEESAEVEIFPEQTLTLSIPSGMDGAYVLTIIPAPFVLAEGETYRVAWDGVEHELVCSSDADGRQYLAHGVLDENGEIATVSFQIVYISPEFNGTEGGSVWIMESTTGSTETEVTRTVAIYHKAVTVKTLDAKFLPDLVSSWNDLSDKPFYEEGSLEEFFPEEEAGFVLSETIGLYISGTTKPASLVIGETYTVYWDGVEYVCTAVDASSINDGAEMIAIGNWSGFGLSGNNEPFAIFTDDTSIASLVVDPTDTSEYHTVGVFKGAVTIRTLDAKFLPMDAIDARIEEYISSALEGDY